MKSMTLNNFSGLLVCVAGLLLAGGAHGQEAPLREAEMPLTMSFDLNTYGQQAATMAAPSVNVGELGDPMGMSIQYSHEGETLGGVSMVLWSGQDETRTTHGQVKAVVTAPSGQVWRSDTVELTTNRNGAGITTDGYKPLRLQHEPSALFVEFERGGEFLFALEDETGRVWGSMRSVLPSQTERQALFEENLQKFRAQGPQTMVLTPSPRSSRP